MGNVRVLYNAGLFYVYGKKHFCPVCGTKVTVSHIVKSFQQALREGMSPTVCGVYPIGSVEVGEKCFYCPKCKKNISFSEMKKFEYTGLKP